MKEVKWYLRKTVLEAKSPNNYDIGPFDSHEAAYDKMCEVAKEINKPIQVDVNGSYIIKGDNCLYWIFGREDGLGEYAPMLANN